MAGIIDSAIGAGMGMVFAGANDKRQYTQQKKLQDLQIRGNKEMADYNKGLALDMWNETNAKAQRKHLEDAGLNVGLMYNGSGAGGATSSAGGGGSVSGAMAPSGSGSEAQLGLTQIAQLKLMEAQTNKTNAEAEKIAGVDTANTVADTTVKTQSIENLIQSAKTDKERQTLINAQGRVEDIKAILATETYEDAKTTVVWNAQRAIADARKAQAEGIVAQSTIMDAVKTIKAEAIGAVLDNAKTQKEMKEIDAKITNMQEQIRQGDVKNAIETFRAEIQAEYPSIMQTSGKMINDLLLIVEKIGLDADGIEETKFKDKVKK